MKCKYCEKEAEWLNPYTDTYMCLDHAMEKFHRYKEEGTIDGIEMLDGLNDLFLRYYPEVEGKDFYFNPKTQKIVFKE